MDIDDRFDLEPSEYEPDEWDPESEFRDPDSSYPTIPTVETAESDAPTELVKNFWIIVLVLNVAIFAVALGLMLIGFRGALDDGGVLILGGLVLFGLAYWRYRRFRYEELDDVLAEHERATVDGDDPSNTKRQQTGAHTDGAKRQQTATIPTEIRTEKPVATSNRPTSEVPSRRPGGEIRRGRNCFPRQSPTPLEETVQG